MFFKGWAAKAEVCLYSPMKILALLCAGQNRHGVEDERVSGEGVATHPDPESCVAGREAAIEA